MSALLSTGQRAWLRAELEQRQRDLERQLAEHRGGMSRVDHARELVEQDLDDAPQREGEREFELAMSDRDSAGLAQVSGALRRMDEDRFGQCVDCGEAIPFDRLKIEPWALRCVACEARREQGGRRAV